MRIQKYRSHKARDCAVVTIAGTDHYLGEYDSPTSREKYHRLIAENLATSNHSPVPSSTDTAPITITELAARYWSHAKTYYVKDGIPTTELHMIKQAMLPSALLRYDARVRV